MAKIKKINTECIMKALYENDIHILTHPGDKAPVYIREIAKACAINNTILEINNRHKHLTVSEIREASLEKDVKFIINSDAHQAKHVGNFEKGLERALEAQLPIERIVNLKR